MKKASLMLLVFILFVGILGVVSAGEEKVTICHMPGTNQVTITVAEPALSAHLAHGDTIGECKDIGNESRVCAALDGYKGTAPETFFIEWGYIYSEEIVTVSILGNTDEIYRTINLKDNHGYCWKKATSNLSTFTLQNCLLPPEKPDYLVLQAYASDNSSFKYSLSCYRP